MHSRMGGQERSLPILTEEEMLALQLQHEADGPAGSLTSRTIFSAILRRNPNIETVIEHTLLLGLKEKCGDKSTGEAAAFADGLWSGFQFVIGACTYVHFLRSGQRDFRSYLATDMARNHIPVIYARELQRMGRFLREGTVIDPALYEGRLRTATEQAYEDAVEITSADPFLTEAFMQQEERIRAHYARWDSGVLPHHLEGFAFGTAHALQLYLQTNECRLPWYRNN